MRALLNFLRGLIEGIYLAFLTMGPLFFALYLFAVNQTAQSMMTSDNLLGTVMIMVITVFIGLALYLSSLRFLLVAPARAIESRYPATNKLELFSLTAGHVSILSLMFWLILKTLSQYAIIPVLLASMVLSLPLMLTILSDFIKLI